MTVSEVALQNGVRRLLRSETFRNLTMDDASPDHAIAVVNAGSRIVQLDRRTLDGTADLAALPDPLTRPAVTGSLGNALPAGAPVVPADGSTFTVTVDGDVFPVVARATHTATLVYGGAAPTTYQGLRPFVEAAIRALDFRRDLAASLLARARDLRIVFLLPDGGNAFMHQLGAAIDQPRILGAEIHRLARDLVIIGLVGLAEIGGIGVDLGALLLHPEQRGAGVEPAGKRNADLLTLGQALQNRGHGGSGRLAGIGTLLARANSKLRAPRLAADAADPRIPEVSARRAAGLPPCRAA